MPAFSNVQTLSVSQEKVTSLAFNARGDWLALGCASLGQLLVWEWRSETYVLKQQGHYYDISTIAYSPDGSYIATGADDAKVGILSLFRHPSCAGPALWHPGVQSDGLRSTRRLCGILNLVATWCR